jgi:pyridoxamine 5'-phosphate oxidase
MTHDLAAERTDYHGDHLLEDTVPASPYPLFRSWMEDAFAAKESGTLPEPTAVVLSTVDAQGRPSSRTVLLKGADEAGFVIYTNYQSRKGRDLEANPMTAMLFGWYPLQRQVRVEGTAVKVPATESDAYFASRPRGSQLGAWASEQSAEVESLSQLQSEYAETERRFTDQPVPRPQHWGGYRIEPQSVEFWQGQPSRMHDRLRYHRTSEGWDLTRLAP